MFGMNITEMAGAVLLESSKTHNPFNFSADYGRNYSSTTTKGDGYQSEGRFNSMAPPMGKPRYGVLYSNCAFNGVKDIGADDLFMDLEYDDDEDDVYVLSPSQRRRMLAAAARQAKKAQKKAAAAEAKTTTGGDSIGKRLFGKLLKLISVKNAFCSSKNVGKGKSKKHGNRRRQRRERALMRLNCRGEEIYYGCEMLFPAGSPPISASVVPMPTIEEESESELQLTIHRFSKILRDKSKTEGGADRRQKSSSSCCSSRDSAASSSLSGPSCSSAAAESDSLDGGDSDGCWSGRRKSGESTQRSALTELDLDDYIDDDISSDDEIASVQSGRFKVSSASRSAGDPPQNGHCLLIKGQN